MLYDPDKQKIAEYIKELDLIDKKEKALNELKSEATTVNSAVDLKALGAKNVELPEFKWDFDDFLTIRTSKTSAPYTEEIAKFQQKIDIITKEIDTTGFDPNLKPAKELEIESLRNQQKAKELEITKLENAAAVEISIELIRKIDEKIAQQKSVAKDLEKAKEKSTKASQTRGMAYWVASILIAVLVVLIGIELFKPGNAIPEAFWWWVPGTLMLLILWALSAVVTGSRNPLALTLHPIASNATNESGQEGYSISNAAGNNQLNPIKSNAQPSLSKLQTLSFFVVVIFCFTTVFAVRTVHNQLGVEIAIPLEVLALIGISITTTLGSQSLTMRYLAENRLTESDKSNLTDNREGKADLTKVQMLVWMLLAILLYLVSFFKMVKLGCYTNPTVAIAHWDSICWAAWSDTTAKVPTAESLKSMVPRLPTFDATLLVLAGVVQGAYFAGKVVTNRVPPQLDGVYAEKQEATTGGTVTVTLVGIFSGQRCINPYSVGTTLFNVMVEITTAGGVKHLINLMDASHLDPAKNNNDLNGKVKTVQVTSSIITLQNLLEKGTKASTTPGKAPEPSPNTYSVRVAVDGVWSESKALIF